MAKRKRELKDFIEEAADKVWEPELVVLRTCLLALGGLPEESRNRVLDFVKDFFREEDW